MRQQKWLIEPLVEYKNAVLNGEQKKDSIICLTMG